MSNVTFVFFVACAALTSTSCTHSGSAGDGSSNGAADGGDAALDAALDAASRFDGSGDGPSMSSADGSFSQLAILAGHADNVRDLDGTGANAAFDSPVAIVDDGAGTLYVADEATLRKVVLSTGVVTTIAGTPGLFGSTDGVGAAARFNGARGLALDGAGNLYIADANNYTVRKLVLATNTVTTFAGSVGNAGQANGTGTGASFTRPWGLAFYEGALYVSDNASGISDSSLIRKIVVASGVVTTIAGGAAGAMDGTGTAAGVGAPQGLVADGLGNLYLVDYQLVRKVVISSGVVTTIAGSYTNGSHDGTGAGAGLSGITKITIDSAGNLFLDDGSAVRKLVPSSGVVTTFAGSLTAEGTTDGVGGAARFEGAHAIAFDKSGSLYVADTSSCTIRKVVVASATVSTPLGAVSAGNADGIGTAAYFAYTDGMALDGAGHIYVRDATVRKVDLTSAAVTTLPVSAPPTQTAAAVAADGAGSLYINGDTTIEKVDLADNAVTLVAGSAAAGEIDGVGAAAAFTFPGALLYENGDLYVGDRATIRRIVLSTGAVTTVAGSVTAGHADGVGPAAGFYYPTGITSDKMGNLYVADTGNSTIRKVVVATGAVTTIAGNVATRGSSDGTASSAQFAGPRGIAYDGNGALYVADTSNGLLRKVDIASGDVTTVLGDVTQRWVSPGDLSSARLHSPMQVVYGPGPALYITDANLVLQLR